MPSTTSTLAPHLVSGPSRPGEGTSAPRPHVEERRAAVAERPVASPAERPAAAPAAVKPGPAAAQPAAQAPVAEAAAPARIATVHAVIVHHRGLEMLEACLASMLASERVALEIVVVLNHCLEPVPELARTSPQVHLLELAHSHGFGEANNLGVAFARRTLGPADYYYFVNNDTLSLPDTLPRLAEQLEARPLAAIAGPQTLIQSAPDFINSLGLNVTEDAWGWDEGIGIALEEYGPLPGVREVMAVTGSALLMDAEAFAEIGGWSEVYDYYFEDIDLGIKAWKRGREVVHVPASVIYHRVSATMTVGAERKFFFFWRNRLLLAGIHWPARLLLAVMKRAIVAEVIRRPWRDSSLQRRALFGALRKAPGILRERWRQRGGDSERWRGFLRPAGSVPRISLPQPGEKPPSQVAAAAAEAAARAAEEQAAREATQISPLPQLLATQVAAPEKAAAPAPRRAVVDAAAEARLRACRPGKPDGKRLLVFGWSPLPFENQRMNYAPGTRSWQFAAALAAEGHAVALACAPIPGATFAPPPPLELEERRGVLIVRLELAAIEHAEERARLVRAFAPDALIGAAPGPSAWAAEAAGELPLWVDFFGDPLAEGQSREAVYPGLASFGAYAGQVAPLLRRGDAFSSVSRRQRLALIGQLGLAGRLRGAAAGHEFVRVLPCAAEEEAPAASLQSGAAADGMPDGAMVVFWSGGFNTWCDVPTLVAGLELAMDERPEMIFVATGGEIQGHDDRTAADFRARVAASRHAGRFRLLGQVPREEADAWLRRADLALITEKRIYERELGSSGRISGWLAAGRAILCSSCSELAAEMERQGLLMTYAAGDAEDLGRRLVAAAQSPEKLDQLAARAAEHARRHLTYAATTAPLRAWAQQPRRAPREAAENEAVRSRSFLVRAEVLPLEILLDERAAAIETLERSERELLAEVRTLEGRRDELEERQAHLEQELEASQESFHRLRGELGQIHQSRMWRIWMAYIGARQRLGRLLGLGKAD